MAARPFLAPSLVRLVQEVDRRWPARKRSAAYSAAQDAWLGDAAHAARQSEHNPDARGCVHATDVAVGGIVVAELLDRLIGDPRVWYVIYDERIWSRTHAWQPLPYTGTDPHTRHVHVSIMTTRHAETDTTGYGLASLSLAHPTNVVRVVARIARKLVRR